MKFNEFVIINIACCWYVVILSNFFLPITCMIFDLLTNYGSDGFSERIGDLEMQIAGNTSLLEACM